MNSVAFKITKWVKNYACNYSIYNKKPPWNVLFFGSNDFSMYSLQIFYNEYKNGSLLNKLEVVTNTNDTSNPVQKFAKQNDLKLHKWPISIPDTAFDVGLVVSFGQLIPEKLIKQFPLGMLNVHASLLPRWRGAAPVIHAIAHGDTKTGVTIMKIKAKKFDIGEIIAQASVDIPSDMLMPELHHKLGHLGAEELFKVVTQLPDIYKRARPQPNEGVLLAPKVSANFGVIHWDTMSSIQIYNRQRALTSLHPLTTTWKGIVVKLLNVKVCADAIKNDCNNNNITPGFIKYDKVAKTLRIFCVDCRWISVEKVRVFGKPVMKAVDFSNGYLKKCKDECFFT